MSHFSVLVASKSLRAIEGLLAPYQEGNIHNCSKEYLEFNDQTEEVEEYYEEVKESGEYEDILEVVTEYFCYEEYNGRYGYWSNPLAKWDWYQFGGRFGGLCLKNGDEDNSVPKSSVDFTMNHSEYEHALKTWELLVEEKEPVTEEEEDIVEWNFYKKEYYLQNFRNKETYATVVATFNAYAFLDPDGNWHAQGEMGWFGGSEENTDVMLNHKMNFYEKYLAKLDEDIILTLVDCHI